MEEAHPTLTIALALAAGVLAQSAARHLRVPGIVLLLVAGVGLGPDGLGWVRPREIGDGLYSLVDVAVAVILFEGGLNLQISRLRREQAVIRRLVTWGALITLAGASLAAHWLLDWHLEQAVLFGSLVVVTGPTVVGPLVAELRLRTRVSTVLEAEGVLIDPIGAILAVLVLELALSPSVDSLAAGGAGLVMRLLFGTVTGALAGLLLGWMLRIRRLVPEGHENILTLSAVLLLFNVSDLVVPNSGILAVTSAGVVVGNMRTPVDRDLREFKDQLSVLLIGLLFVMLAADVRFEQVQMLGWDGLLVVVALVLVVRPLGVLLSSLGSDLSRRERMFVAGVAPRGIVAAAIASLVAGALEGKGMSGGLELRALVFLTISVTVVWTGLIAHPLARLLDIRLPGREGIAILGANALGLALAKALREGGRSIVFLDSNPQSCRAVEEAGFNVIFGNAIQERTMQRARFESVETAIAITGNKELNGVFISRAREAFDVPLGLAAAAQVDGGLIAEMIERREVDVVFEDSHDVQRWDVRSRRGDMEVVRRRYRETKIEAGEDSEAAASGERFVILAIHRDDAALPMAMSFEPRKGDIATIAIHQPEEDDAYRILESVGWWEIPEMVEGAEAGESAESSVTS